MPKETITGSGEGNLVRLKYTFRFGDKFDEPNDDWLLLPTARARDKEKDCCFGKYCYFDHHSWAEGQEDEGSDSPAALYWTSRDTGIWRRYFFNCQSKKKIVPIIQSTVEPSVIPKITTVGPAKAEDNKAKEPEVERVTKMPEIMSPPGATSLSKVQKTSVATPKRRRMANVLDAVLETTKVLSPAPAKKVAPTKAKLQAKTETRQAETEAGPSVPTEIEPATPEEKATEQIAPEKIETPALEALIENADYIFRHASGKKLTEGENLEARHYAWKLKYPKGALVFNGSSEDDFLYCLSDNKEISVCREIGRSIGFPKLEDSLSILSKDDLADSLAYNNINV
jgi:hypothetical protein